MKMIKREPLFPTYNSPKGVDEEQEENEEKKLLQICRLS